MSLPWGIPLPTGRFPILAGLMGFLSAITGRLISWLMMVKLTGALARLGMFTAVLIVVATSTVGLVLYVNNLLTEIINGLSPLGQLVVAGIASAFPVNMPYYITVIVGYYVFSITTHFTIEIAKFKANMADKASKRFIA
jgi:hypothetical protein